MRAKKVIFATGYETHEHLRRYLGKLTSTYVIVSEPIPDFDGWHERSLIWETSRPYSYLRTVEDRAMIGGQDIDFVDQERRDAAIGDKSRRLCEIFRSLFPEIDFQISAAWAGTFGETADGLPHIGETDGLPSTYFALGYGANGITASAVAAEIIRDAYLGRKNPAARLFRPDR
ncbi:MAG: NAD(P)/FAD-dependent oxidoreductase [Verrucomicrobiales bacterium]